MLLFPSKWYSVIYSKIQLTSWLNLTLKNITVRCKKLTIVLGQKIITWPFVRRKQVSMSAKVCYCCYILALVLACFLLMKGCTLIFWPKTISASFLHVMVLFFKMKFNHSSECQFVLLHCHTLLPDWLSK